MPNIPQMNSVWSDLGQAWVKSTKGAGATPAAVAFKAAARTSRTRSARTDEPKAGALSGRPPSSPLRELRRRPHPHTDRRRLQAGARRAGVAAFSGSPVTSSRSSSSRCRTRSASGRPTYSPTSRAGCAPILVAATAAIDVIYLAPGRWTLPAEVPDPRDRVPARVPDRPDRLHDRGRALELLDRPHHHQGRRDQADQDQLAAAAGERQAVRGCARRATRTGSSS